jgi:hypothetical protein
MLPAESKEGDEMKKPLQLIKRLQTPPPNIYQMAASDLNHLLSIKSDDMAFLISTVLKMTFPLLWFFWCILGES